MKKEAVIYAAQQGCNKKEAAEALGVSYVTLWRFLNVNPEIAKMFPTKLEVERARTPGIRCGITYEQIEPYLKKRWYIGDIAEELKVNRATIYRIIKFRKKK